MLRQFLEQAATRFGESEKLSGERLGALLRPVTERLQRYEEGVARVEQERRGAFSELKGQIEAMRVGQEKVSSEAAKLVNSLRNAPKSRGRWGEQQLRNVLESCGLAEHTDFLMEVSVSDGEGGRLRPDAIVRVPGGKSLIIDAKVSLNAYQDAFGAVEEVEKLAALAAHVQSMRNHINGLANKSYWAQFEDAPDYVIMFIPGEHFLAAAAERAPDLIETAFRNGVIIASTINMLALAKVMANMRREEALAEEARVIGAIGKELYKRLATLTEHIHKLGRNLGQATAAYNGMIGSLETQVLVQARRFEELKIDTGGKAIEAPQVIETGIRPLVKLVGGEGEAAAE